MAKKPSVDEIKAIVGEADKIYGALWKKFDEDDMFYELQFKHLIEIPTQFEKDVVIVPTGRDMIDAFVDNIDIGNVRVRVNKKGTSAKAKEAMEMERKFYLGLMHRINVESQIAPIRVCSKHYAAHGLCVMKSVWDADNWLWEPKQKDGESKKVYGIRLDEWRSDTHFSMPILWLPIHPANIIPDPYQGGQLYVIERRKKLVFDAKRMWPRWKNSKSKGVTDTVEYISYWDKDYRCDLLDGEPILGVSKHGYGHIPYTLIESGLGNMDKDAKPESRYVGSSRYMFDMLVAESDLYSVNKIRTKREVLKGGYTRGRDGTNLPEIKQAYGEYPNIPDGVEIFDWDIKPPPAEAFIQLDVTRDYIDSHAGPRSVRGLSEENVRSGAHERFRVAQASARFGYATPSFQNGIAQVLAKSAMIVVNKIPGNFRVWARTPSDEIDVLVKKDLLKPPFAPYVEFSPISEEDEYRRQDSLIKQRQAGLISREFAWTQMNNVDPQKMQRDVDKEMLKMSPPIQQLNAQVYAQMLQQAYIENGVMPPPMGGGMEQGQSQAGGGQRPMVPGIPEKAVPGSTQDMDNQMRQLTNRNNSGIQGGQGVGGGGNR